MSVKMLILPPKLTREFVLPAMGIDRRIYGPFTEFEVLDQMPHNQCKQVAPYGRWTQLMLRRCCRRYAAPSR